MQHVHVFLLVAGAVAVTAVCRRRGWPAPLVLVAVAIVVSFVPGVPRFEIDSHVLLEFVLPPLLYSAALSSSYRDFRSSLNSITRLGVGLVLVSAVAVALVFWWLEPSVPFAAALVLGAVVAPPDAVAAAAVGKRLGSAPPRDDPAVGREPHQRRHLADALQGGPRRRRHGRLGPRRRAGHVRARGRRRGGGRPGDRLGRARGAAAAGRPGGRVRDRAADAVRGVLVGRGDRRLGGARRRRRRPVPRPHRPRAPGTRRGSTRSRSGPRSTSLLEAFTFALIGMQLPWVVRDVIASDQGLRHGVLVSLVVLLVAVLVRPVYIFGTARFDHLRLRGSHRPPEDSLSARESAVVSWAGMRGVVTLAAAAAIPVTSRGRTVPRAGHPAARRLHRGHRHPPGAGADAAVGHHAARRRLGGRDRAATPRRRPRSGWRPPTRCTTCSSASGTTGAGSSEQSAPTSSIDRLSGVWRARATAAAGLLDPDSADERVPDDGRTALGARTAPPRRRACGPSGCAGRSSPPSARCSWTGGTPATWTRRSCGG